MIQAAFAARLSPLFSRKPMTRARIRFTLPYCEPDLRCQFLFHAWLAAAPADMERALLKIASVL